MALLVETGFTTAAGLLSYLEEDDMQICGMVLEKLHPIVDEYWSEIAGSVTAIESLSEMESFPQREIAASIASKCFFHLEAYPDALRLALSAGSYFSVDDDSLYGQTMVAKGIDEYLSIRKAHARGDEDAPPLDPRLEAVVESMIHRCYRDGRFGQALGIALEAQRLDVARDAILRSPDVGEMLLSCQHVVQRVDLPKRFRLEVMTELVELHKIQPERNTSSICQLLQFLGRPGDVSCELDNLLRGSDDEALLALQIGFDLCENEDQAFIMAVHSGLPSKASVKRELAAAAASTAGENETTPGGETPGAPVAQGDATVVETPGAPVNPDSASAAPAPAPAAAPAPDAEGAVGEAKGEDEVDDDEDVPVPEGAPDNYWARLERLNRILVGGFDVDLWLYFLYRNNNTDSILLKNIKTAVENRSSILHGATVMTHANMNAGTTVDAFLRDNLEWLAKANNWAKFSATASIGVVHKGHTSASMQLLQPYLPSGGAASSPYSEGGALYALGLIHANKGGAGDSRIIEYLRNALANANGNETVIHGACLGLGLASMGTQNAEIYEQLKDCVFSDSAVAGEAAALGIGLLLVGAGNSSPLAATCLDEMVAYAHDTKHEKIIRSIAMSIALIHLGQEEDAEGIIEQLSRDRDALMRYGAMYTIGLAYCGTGSNAAVRRLLHVAVSDVSDDVRRAAVTCLGLVLFRQPEKVPALLSLLSESFNPHVRYGTCMAVGFACAGSSMPEAVSFLDPMLKDSTDFVRQGALMAEAMVLMTDSEARNPKVKSFREKVAEMTTDKHQSVMAKMGAIAAAGILDAGGRNVVISLQSRAGFTRSTAAVGLTLWAQYWYWFPLQHLLSLAMQPVAVIGLTGELAMPKDFAVTCNARASQFAYPKKLTEKKEETKERVATAVLSTTAKAKARAAKKEEAKKASTGDSSGAAAMEVDTPQEKTAGETKEEGKSETKEETKEEAKAPAKEPPVHQLQNPARVTMAQRAYVTWNMDQRYVPVRPTTTPVGIVVLRDTRPDEPQELIAMRTPEAGEEEEADPPEPFEWEPPQ